MPVSYAQFSLRLRHEKLSTPKMIKLLGKYAVYYPVVMAHVWVIGAMYYFFKWEFRRANTPPHPEHGYPPISILLPCHNEGDNVRETVAWLQKQDYPNFDIIAINDGSRDNTGEILDELSLASTQLRIIHLAKNQGKATGLRMGALLSKSEYLVCIDGDALLEPDACRWMVNHFIDSPRVGAVTGNPRIRNRSSLLGKIQVGEFSCIIGMIKRAQRIYGRIFSVSGVIVAFRKQALHDVGYWSTDMMTEDVDITWKLQRGRWDIRYEPSAKCWVLMPETINGLWKQRLRWAKGGMQVLSKNVGLLFHWSERHMWVLVLEALASVAWVYTLAALTIILLVSTITGGWEQVLAWPVEWGTVSIEVTLTCLTQFACGFFLDSRYEKGIWRYYFWMIWYPVVYWMLNAAATFVGLPKALLNRNRGLATWVSPDRGLKP